MAQGHSTSTLCLLIHTPVERLPLEVADNDIFPMAGHHLEEVYRPQVDLLEGWPSIRF